MNYNIRALKIEIIIAVKEEKRVRETLLTVSY